MITSCLATLRASGLIDEARARLFQETHDELLQSLKGSMGDAAAAARAADDTMAAIRTQMDISKRRTLLKYATRRTIVDNIKASGADLDHAVLAHFDMDERAPGIRSIPLHARVIRNQAWAKMDDLALGLERDTFTRIQNVRDILDFVYEAFGEKTGNKAAAAFNAGWRNSSEWLRQRFNAAGGAIGKLKDWGLPQKHDADLIRAATLEGWKEKIIPRLNLARMINRDTGMPFTPLQLDKFLNDIFDAITTDGWNERKLSSGKRVALANSRNEARFLIFNNADDWLAYQREFGGLAGVDDRAVAGRIQELITEHVDGMADDTAAMEILGPDAHATVGWLGNLLHKAAATETLGDGRYYTAADRARKAARRMDQMWSYIRGELSAPVSERVARFGSGVRSVNVASKLGSTFLSALPDAWANYMTRRYNGMPGWPVALDYVAGMLPYVRAGDKRRAVRAGLIADEMISYLGAMHRFGMELRASGKSAHVAGTVMNGGLLSRWSRVGKQSFGLRFMGYLADHASHSFDALPARLRNRMERHGVDADGWDKMRAWGIDPEDGFLRFDLLADAEGLPPGEGQALADRLLAMTLAETEFAVPEATTAVRAGLTLGTRAGTWDGEAVRAGTQFLGFPVSIVLQHMNRALHGGGMNPAQYAAQLFLGMTLLGAMANQLSEIVKGRDPMPVNTADFWMAAAMRGGGLGIFGDLLFSDYSRAGGGLTSLALGPTFGQVDQLLNLTIGNAQSVLGGDDTNFGRELVRFLKANTPGSNLWYARLAFDRLIWGTAQEWLDPDAHAAHRRMIRRAEREFGNSYWWVPGESAPERLPDLMNAFEGEAG